MTKIRKSLSILLCLAVIMGLFPLTVSASEYTSCRSGTVSWQMIYDNPKTYYWVDSEDEYCALTAVKSGKYYYVTLYRTKKGDELRYLKQEKDDDSGSKKEWDSASAVYTGGVLYKKDSGSSSGGTFGGTTIADGTYTATSNSSYKKDGETYTATVTVTVSGGKITALTATGPTSSSDNKSYFNKALNGISSSLIGQTATENSGENVDAVSKATNSSKLIKEAITLALKNVPSGGGTSSGATIADGTYTATSNSTYKKDGETYSATVQVTVSGGKITALTATGPTSSDNKSYFNKALNGISSGLVGQTATADSGNNVDAVSKATNSSKLIKEAITLALKNAPSGGGSETPETYTVIWKNYDGTTLETDKNVSAGTKPSYDGAIPSKASDSQYEYVFAGWAESSYQTSGTPANSLPTVSGNVTYYAAFSKTEIVSVADGLYGDNSATVQRFGYTPVVTVTVKNGIITAVTANADTNENNLGFLEEALEGLQNRLVGKSVSVATALNTDTDAVSGATYASNAIILDIKQALSQSPKGNCTVIWKNYDGTILKTDTAVYGSKTVQYNGTPTRTEDDSYVYTFKGWTPAVSKFVTENAVYTAEYNSQEKEQPAPVFADGKYVDGTGRVPFGYTPVVKITVENGTVKTVDVTSKDVGSNAYYLNTAKTWIKNQLEGKTADTNLLDGVDAVSGATATKKVVLESVTKALNSENVVSWTDDNGNVLDSAKVSNGTTPEYDGAEPSKTDYNFIGWTPEIHTVNGNEVYKAVFEAKLVEYTVTYDVLNDSQKQKAGDTVTVTSVIPTKDGYKFDGWSLDGRKITADTFEMPARNVVLKAIWKEWYHEGIYGDDSVTENVLYTYHLIVSVSVNNNNQIVDVTADTDEDKDTLEYFGFYEALEYVNQQLMYEDISTDNLERVYYASNPDLGSDAPIFVSDIIAGVIEALKNESKEMYTITVRNSDGSVAKTYSNIRYGTRTEDVIQIPVKESNEKYTYTFAGWKEPINTFVTENAEYTAQYNEKVNRYIVTWKNEDGTVLKKEIAEYGTIPSYNGDTPKKASSEYYTYTFAGWDKDILEVTGNVEYTAVFEQKIAKALANESEILTASPKLGETVAIKALASGGEGGYSYAVYYKRDSASTWTTCSSWTDKTEFSVTPTAAVKYNICVKIKDKSGTLAKKYFDIDIVNSFVNTSTFDAENIQLGKSINITASAEGGFGDYLYSVYYKSESIEQWTTYSSWTNKTEFSITPKSVTKYNVCVKVKDKNGSIAKKYFDVNVTSSFVNTSTINAENINKGEAVIIKASAEGGFGNYTYSVYYKSQSKQQWTTYAPWTDETTFSITPPSALVYNICVKVKDQNGMIAKKYFDVSVKDISLKNQSYLSSTEVSVNEPVTFYAQAQNGTEIYEYAYYYKKTANTTWKTLSGWSENSIKNLSFTEAGTYNACIKVKDSSGKIEKKYFVITVR